MEKNKFYQAPATRVAPIWTEPFCKSGTVPDYEPIDGFEWGDE